MPRATQTWAEFWRRFRLDLLWDSSPGPSLLSPLPSMPSFLPASAGLAPTRSREAISGCAKAIFCWHSCLLQLPTIGASHWRHAQSYVAAIGAVWGIPSLRQSLNRRGDRPDPAIDGV